MTFQKTSSSENYCLADAIDATSPERRLLASLGIRQNGAGALPAVRTAARAIAAATEFHLSERATEWVQILHALVKRLAVEAAEYTWLDLLCPVAGHRPICDVIAAPARCALPVQARERLDAWLGIHLFHALARGGLVAASVVADWETLRRTGEPRVNTPWSWIEAAKCMPLDTASINQLLSTTTNVRLGDALRLTLAALAADIPTPAAARLVAVAGAPRAASRFQDGAEELLGDDDESDEDNQGGDASEGVPSSLMDLLLHRGMHAGYRGQFGITSIYGELPPANLRRVCLALAATLRSGSEADRTRSAVAEVSLKISLAPRRTVELPLACNADVWLDLPNRSVCWNFERVLAPRECDSANTPSRCQPIRIRLSDACVDRLMELLADRPEAASLRELAAVGASNSALARWLADYGVFLRSHGDDNYRAYAVRFARSYRSVYLDRGHGAIAAALLGLDFATTPAGLLHYVSLPPALVTEWQMDVDRYLGLQWSAEVALEERM